MKRLQWKFPVLLYNRVSMRGLNRQVNTPLFVPDYIASSIADVDFELLKKRGIRHIAFDADSTLVHFRGTVLSADNLRLLKQKRRLFKSWCIASNRPYDNLRGLAESIDAGVIRARPHARKPSKRYFQRILDQFQARPAEIAMIGDKLIADMYGAKRIGLVTIWVERIGPDSPWDWALRTRRIEKHLMRRYLRQ